MKPQKIRSPILYIIIFLIISTICVYLSASLSNGTAVVIKDSFILTFLGLIAGITILCFTIVFSNIEKIRSYGKTDNTDKTIERLFKGLKQDTISAVFSLIICFVVIIVRDITISVSLPSVSFITHQQVISIIEIVLIFVSLKAIFDVMLRLFGLLEVSSSVTQNKIK